MCNGLGVYLVIIANFEQLNSYWNCISEFITPSRNQGVIQANMEVRTSMLTKVVKKCGKQYLYLVILQIIKETKIEFLQDDIPYRPMCRPVLFHTQSHSTSLKLKE